MTTYSVSSVLDKTQHSADIDEHCVVLDGVAYNVESTDDSRVFNFIDSNGIAVPGSISVSPDRTILVSLRGYVYEFDVKTEREQYFARLLRETAGRLPKVTKMSAPMPGLLKTVHVREGDQVVKGQKLFVLEAMKMENDLCAPHDGIASKVATNGGEAVEKGKVLCVVEQKAQV